MVEVFKLDVTGKYDRYTLSQVDGRGQLTLNDAPFGGSVPRGFDRVVLFHQVKANTPLLVFDVISPQPSGSGANLTWRASEGRVVVTGKLRCFLAQHTDLDFEISIVGINSPSVRYERFQVEDQRVALPNPSNIQQALSAALLPLNNLTVANYASEFERKINLTAAPGTGTVNQPVSVSFITSSGNPDNDYFRFHFRRSFVFDAGQDVLIFTKRVKIERRNYNWEIQQYPSRDLRNGHRKINREGGTPSPWIVQVDGFPADSIIPYWNGFLSQYFDSLKTVRGGLPVSFVPELAPRPGDQLTKRWGVSYLLLDALQNIAAVSDDFDISALDIEKNPTGQIKVIPMVTQPVQEQELAITAFPQLRKHDEKPLGGGVLSATIDPSPHNMRGRFDVTNVYERGIVIYPGNVPGSGQDPQTTAVRMGALDIEFATESDATPDTNSQIRIRPYQIIDASRPANEGRYRTLLEAHVSAAFAVSEVRAGGQDGIPGEDFVPENSSASALEDCRLSPITPEEILAIENEPKLASDFAVKIEAHFRRKRPLVFEPEIALPRRNKPVKYRLRVDEDAEQGKSQTLRLTLSIKPSPPGLPNPSVEPPNQVIVLDSSPFMVAMVEYRPFATQAETVDIGNWNNAGVEGTNWQLKSLSQPFDLILPSQGIGEEMEKNRNVKPGSAVDFRLSPPARIKLKGSDRPQNFTEPPWNLRRLLGYSGQRNQGAPIEHLQFELLYGLSCSSEYPFLRLAEIDSLLGAIQGRLPEQARSVLTSDDAKGFYQAARIEWAKLFQRYLSRIAILEPWDSHQRERLLISENTVCKIRSVDEPNEFRKADLHPPFPPTAAPGPTPDDRLRGGVTWGFESKNVYDAVMRTNGRLNPQSDDGGANVSDLYFSAVGGWGHVKAPFDKKRSIIYGDVAMGRTYHYKLERIGRIGVWWNLAKHVIVYERTVVPSRQMFQLQNPLLGLAIIRKVHEYVEILEETRNYPDKGNGEAESLKQQRGFVAACSFPKGARYNVLSSWGSEVGTIGWKVPLWNPSATPPDVYPKPQVHLNLMSDVAGESVPVPCLIAAPENLFFYTDTRKSTDGNPHEWDPVKDVDFVDLPRPVPCSDFKDGKNVQNTPTDPAVPVGFSPCTFKLEPARVPTNVVAERAGKPLSAVLETVTMMRAQVAEVVRQVSEQPYEKLALLRQPAVELYRDLVSRIPVDPALAERNAQQIIGDIERAVLNSPQLRSIEGTMSTLRSQLVRETSRFQAMIDAYEDRVFSNIEKSLTERYDALQDSVIGQVTARYDELIAITPDQWNTNRAKYVELASRALGQLQEKVLLLNSSAGILQKTIRRYVEAYAVWAEASAQQAFAIRDFLASGDRLVGQRLKDFQKLIRELLEIADTLRDQVANGVFRPAEAWLPDPHLKLFQDYFKALVEQFDGNQQIVSIRELIKGLLKDQVEIPLIQARATIEFVGRQEWTDARDRLNTFNRTLRVVEAELNSIPGQWVDAQYQRLRLLTATSPHSEFRAAVMDLRARIQPGGQLFTELTRIRGVIRNTLGSVIQYTAGSIIAQIDDLERQLANIRNNLRAYLSNNLDKLRTALERRLEDLVGGIKDFAESNVRGLLPADGALIYAKADSVARLVSAFGKPPEVPNLTFDRPEIAYFYKELDKQVGLTPVISRVAQVSAIAKELQALGVALPTEGVLERLLPPSLANFNFSDILPKFSGIDLKNLFSGLKMPDMGTENIKVSHGVDQQSRRAWVQSDVNVRITEPATVFTIGPVRLRLTSADFVGKMRFEAGLNEAPKRVVQGSITGTWEIVISEIPIVKFHKTELRFDDSGNFRFNLSPANVELPGVMAFVSDFLKSFSNPESGFSIGLTPKGVRAVLNLPIPDIQGATSGISGLTLGMAFGLDFSDQFKITVAFLLAKKEAPFALTIFILGGGGYIELETSYTPSNGVIGCRAEIGITASASLAISLGPIRGGVYVYFGVTANVDLRSDGGGTGLTIGIMLLIRGVVDILGIVSAEVALLLEVNYNNGQLIGRGTVSIKIKICWCFTLKVRRSVTYTVGSGSRTSENRALGSMDQTTAMLTDENRRRGPNAEGDTTDPMFAAQTRIEFQRLAAEYIGMLS